MPSKKKRKLSPRKIGRLLLLIMAAALFVHLLRCTPHATSPAAATPRLTPGPYDTRFTDKNDLQLAAAIAHGLRRPIGGRNAGSGALRGLQPIRTCPLYAVDTLTHSIPYLTPAAARLLDRIGRAFRDSLVRRGMPPVRFIVTSALRTEEDVEQLRRVNRNATENSAHRYATTFDLSNLRYMPAEATRIPKAELPETPRYRQVMEYVLRDLRHAGWCYVLEERKQHCYHITSRL